MNIIDEMYRIAGVKDSKSFYNKFPTEKAFMAKYGKEFRKAMRGAKIKKAQTGLSQPNWEEILKPAQEKPLEMEDWMTDSSVWDVGKKGVDWGNIASKSLPVAGDLAEGVRMLIEEKKQRDKTKQYAGVTEVMKDASQTRPEDIIRRYLRPEYERTSGEEFYPIEGIGTDVLAKNGIHIKPSKRGTFTTAAKKHGKSVQGFASQVLANKGNYSPAMVKKANFARNASKWKKAEDGTAIPWDMAGDRVSNILTEIMGESGGGNVGGAIGQGVGSIFGPAGSAIGKVGGQIIGSVVDPFPGQIKKYKREITGNVGTMAAQAGAIGTQNLYAGHMEDGGEITPLKSTLPIYSQQELIPIPSVFSDTLTFGKNGRTYKQEADSIDKEVADIRKKGKLGMKDYTRLRELGLSKEDLMSHQMKNKKMKKGGTVSGMEANGELQMLDDGNIRPISYNPFSGETVQFEGDSHAEGGMNISFGNSPVEVEGGEPAAKTDEDSLVVYGDLPVPGYRGKKFKNVVKDIAKKEERLNKKIEKSSKGLEEIEINTPFDKLKADTLNINLKGSGEHLKKYADEKEHLALLQEAINETAEENNLDASSLAKGNIKKAKKGAVVKAQSGKTFPNFTPKYDFYPSGPDVQIPLRPSETYSIGNNNSILPSEFEVRSAVGLQNAFKKQPSSTPEELVRDDRFPNKGLVEPISSLNIAPRPSDRIDDLTAIESLGKASRQSQDKVIDVISDAYDNKKLGKEERARLIMDALNSVVPYFKPSDAEDLDPRQIMGELMALGEKEEPVWAQTIQPDLSTPYSISLDDQKNEIIAQTRSAQRMAGNNPAAQSYIAAQAYDALNKIKGEEFRYNQAMKDKVYAENRATMNQIKRENLGVLDKLYERQSMAKSNTKAILRNALNSISDKYLKNKLEKSTLAAYENLYDYRFGPSYRARHVGPLAQFDSYGSDQYSDLSRIPEDRELYYRKLDSGEYEPVDIRRASRTRSPIVKNGGIVKALKNI